MILRSQNLKSERNPEDALGIERVLQFRRREAEEFERLAADSGADSPQFIEMDCQNM
jgi:hypothetical protein